MKISRILFIEFEDRTSAIHLVPILKELKGNKNFEPLVLCQKDTYLFRKSKELGLTIFPVLNYIEFNVHKPKTYFCFLINLITIFRIIIKYKVDAIHCHRLNWAYLGIIASEFFKLPIFIDIVFVEKLTSGFQNLLIRSSKRSIFLAVSKFAKRKFCKFYEISGKKVYVFYGGLNTGIDEIQLDKDKCLPKMKEKSKLIMSKLRNKKVIAMVSRLDPYKGVDVFIESAGILKKKNEELNFVFLGYRKDKKYREECLKNSQSYIKNCRQRIKNLNLENNFYILNWTPDIELFYPFFI